MRSARMLKQNFQIREDRVELACLAVQQTFWSDLFKASSNQNRSARQAVNLEQCLRELCPVGIDKHWVNWFCPP